MARGARTQTQRRKLEAERRKLAAAGYLRVLLNRGAYRSLWARVVDKTGTDEISQAAVAKVIVDHVAAAAGEEPGELAYRAWKDVVHRALSGRALTPQTLGLFTAAFQFGEEDARQLWSLFLGVTPQEARQAEVDQIPAITVLGLRAVEAEWLAVKLDLWRIGGTDEDLAMCDAIGGRLPR